MIGHSTGDASYHRQQYDNYVENIKTGSLYEVVSMDAIDATNERDGLLVAVYRGKDGRLFVRERREFEEKFKRTPNPYLRVSETN